MWGSVHLLKASKDSPPHFWFWGHTWWLVSPYMTSAPPQPANSPHTHPVPASFGERTAAAHGCDAAARLQLHHILWKVQSKRSSSSQSDHRCSPPPANRGVIKPETRRWGAQMFTQEVLRNVTQVCDLWPPQAHTAESAHFWVFFICEVDEDPSDSVKHIRLSPWTFQFTFFISICRFICHSLFYQVIRM